MQQVTEFLFNLIVKPIQLLLEYLFQNIYHASQNVPLTVLMLSFIVSVLCLPLYLRADDLQLEENEIQKKLSKRVNAIKKNFKGDERQFLLQTYYKQNNYHPLMGLRLSLSLLLQIPLFLAAYTFFCHLTLINGMSCGFISDLSLPDGLLKICGFNINLFPILMTAVNLAAGFVYTKDRSLSGNKVLIFMSLIFLVLLYNSPAALVIYWTFNNVFSLIKNICLKLFSHKDFINYVIIFSTAVYVILAITNWVPQKVLLIICLLAIIAKHSESKNYAFDFDYRNLYLLSIISCYVLLGVFIPSNVVSSAPLEFLFTNDRDPISILSFVNTVFAGVYIFWGLWIYYFSNVKLKKVLSITVCLSFICFLVNLLTIKMPDGILNNTLIFETSNLSSGSYILNNYFIHVLILFVCIAIPVLLIIKNKTKLLIRLLMLNIVTCLIMSAFNYAKIISTLDSYKKVKNQNVNTEEKYIKLSKSKKNVLIIFIDRAINSFLPIIFDEQPKLYKQFEGFIYYPNTLSYAGYTLLGYLPITGGYEYTPFRLNESNAVFDEKFNEALAVLPAIFKLNGFESTTINPVGRDDWSIDNVGEFKVNDKYYDEYSIVVKEIPVDIVKDLKNNLKLFDNSMTKRNLVYFSIFSVLPQQIRIFLYDNGSYHQMMDYSIEKSTYDRMFLKNYAELHYLPKLTSFSQTGNTFTVFNNSLPHEPKLLNYPNYDLGGENDEKYIPPMPLEDKYSLRYYHSNAATLRLLGNYMDFLRENNVYDNTRIIIVSDHGFSFGIKNPRLGDFETKNLFFYNPVLIVKDFNSRSEFKTVKDLMTNGDVPLLATKDLIKNPVNPFTHKMLTDKDKREGVLIKNDNRYQPKYYTGKKRILKLCDRFHYVKDDSLNHNNWILDIPYPKAEIIYQKTKGD